MWADFVGIVGEDERVRKEEGRGFEEGWRAGCRYFRMIYNL